MDDLKQPVLIIGHQGLVSEALQEVLQEQGLHFVATSSHQATRVHPVLNILDKANIRSTLQKIKPRCVIHAANLAGGVVFCEKNPDVARQFHLDATQNIGMVCRDIGAKLIFISTECVFDGKKEIYTEEDQTNPLNVYGCCKWESEAWLQKNLNNALIVRTMSVFGWQPQTKTPNAVMKAYFSCRDKTSWPVAVYRYGTPTYAKNLAQAICELVEHNASGTYHVAGTTYVSRYDWLKKACAKLGWDSRYLIPEEEKPSDVPYPHRVHLSVEKFSKNFKTHLMSLDESLEALAKDIRRV
jgi:dTDP-4-dehydrorhamnose reductase